MQILNTKSNLKNPARCARAYKVPARRRGGSVIVIVALSLVVLSGFAALAVDYGVMVNDANRLQRSADAAALAGSTQLKKTGYDPVDTYNARLVAANVMAQNGIANFDANTITFNATNTKMTVPASTRRNYFFAPVFRLIDRNSATSGQIARSASAGRTALKGVPAAAPLAITTTDYYRYKDGASFDVELIRNHEESFDPGEVVGLDLRLGNNGKSGANFEDDVRDGVNRTAEIGEDNNALNSSITSQGAKMIAAINNRIARANGAPWYDNGFKYIYPNYPANDPRVMTIVVANPSPQDNNNPMIRTQFFITVYIEDIDENNVNGNGNGKGKGKAGGGPLLQLRILPPQLYSSDRNDIIIGDDNTPTGGPAVIGLTD